ncbi:prepilin-type N-terminal cleavage/methylation domain-containing protein [Thiospirochaeta perfilievii]|uniref:Prepilin-type N-terminal cleavage/methylation domain-containing protein n=1 Tax=Thiospirochaeta perfilievii TaxID=252967 RepID=A0A5C1Q9R7_9SPIO|nr:prepilin-type N-terminal cleavage/methylation domain-containing protein [Thiospirochaeta perfilievii]QEN04217.1 prepilin-type N-terminal cleavage/methylation domain-containing protein [Thiospirochaeta perfilievii]
MSSSKTYSNDGFTLIEVIVAILIVAIISTVIYTNLTDISQAVSKSKQSLNRDSDILTLRTILLTEVTNINSPWYIKELKVEKDDKAIKIYYYNGDPNRFISFYFSDGIRIFIDSSEIFYSNLLDGKFLLDNRTLQYTEKEIYFCLTLL